MKKIFSFLPVLFLLLACDDSNTDSTEEMITLENCDGIVADNVPDFYKSYFSCVDVSMSGSNVIIFTEGEPPYQSWYYPQDHPNYIEYVSKGIQYFKNPNLIAAKQHQISIPPTPVSRNLTINNAMIDGIPNTNNNEYHMGLAGIALNGVAIFNPLAAPGHDIEEEKYSFDYYNAHPTPDGSYHYHTATQGPLEVLQDKGLITNASIRPAEVELYGIMCDGTVILGCTELNGSVPNNSGFDAQNGHVHDIQNKSGKIQFTNRYHTHLCPDTFSYHKFTPEIQYYEGCN